MTMRVNYEVRIFLCTFAKMSIEQTQGILAAEFEVMLAEEIWQDCTHF